MVVVPVTAVVVSAVEMGLVVVVTCWVVVPVVTVPMGRVVVDPGPATIVVAVPVVVIGLVVETSWVLIGLVVVTTPMVVVGLVVMICWVVEQVHSRRTA